MPFIEKSATSMKPDTVDTCTPAECYDAIATAQYETFGPELSAALDVWLAGRKATTSLTAIDLGAGTGLSTAVLSAACPDAQVTVCEPDADLRAALMTRVTCCGLRDQVTVRDWTAGVLCAEWRKPVDVVVAANMLYNLDPLARSQLLAWLADWLTADGVAIIGPLAEHDRPSTAATSGAPASGEEVYASAHVGQLRYDGAIAFEPGTGGAPQTRLIWRIWEGNNLIREYSRRSESYPVSAPAFCAEAAEVGLISKTYPGELVVLRATKTHS